MADDLTPAKLYIFEKIARVLNDFSATTNEIERLEQKKIALGQEVNDLTTAAKVFNIDLDTEFSRWAAEKAAVETAAAPDGQTVLPAPQISQMRSRTVKELVLEAAQKAYPQPIRAAEARKQIEAQGMKTHEKTVGMTMYRLLQDGKLRREGWNWFFVPEDQRQAPPSGEESPASDAGLFSDAAE